MTPQESMNLASHIADALREVSPFRDFAGWETAQRLNDFIDIQGRPSSIFRPTLTCNGQEWRARYGDVVGVGDSPEKAMLDFDKNWTKKL